MATRMLIDALHPEEIRMVVADQKHILDFDFSSASKKQLKGNIYLAKITRVEPSLQAAFVEYGGNKQGFLPFSEIHPDYYQIPISDRKRLMEEADDQESAEEMPEEAPAAETAAPAEEISAEPTTEEPPPTIDAEHPAYLSQEAAEMPEDPAQEELPMENAEPAEQPAEAASAATEEKSAEDGLETLPNEEEELRSRPKRNFTKRYRIQEVIRRGQIVLVQVIKEERGNKGASLTTFLSLAGRYCVLMPNSPKDGGISRKIASAEDRKRLKQITAEFKCAKGMSVIIRTAGMGRTRAEIKRDYDYLVKLWNHIRETTLQSNAPALIYEEGNIIKRAIRDQYSSDFEEVLIEGEEGYHAAKEFMKLLLPSHTPKIKLYQGSTPLFYAYDIEDQLLEMHDPVVKLRSGGYIVINPTEALISIDVNSGRSTGERNIEETATKTNLEAAAEVARQLRLRDLAGLIVIDFIDMMESRNRRAVERALKDALKADRAKIQIGRISPFGLMEMSRQRLRPSISETNMVQCPHCTGRGFVRSNDSMSIQIIRALEKEAASGAWSGFRLFAPQAVALHLLNHKREALRSIEGRHGVSIQVLVDGELAMSDFNLEKMRRAQNQPGKRREQSQGAAILNMASMPDIQPDPVEEEMAPGDDEVVIESSEIAEGANIREVSGEPGEGRRGRRRGRRGRRGGRHDRDRNFDTPQESNDNTPAESVGAEPVEAAPESERSSRPPRGRDRNRRGGRRRWRDGDAAPRAAEPTADNGSDGQALPRFATEDRTQPEPEPQHAVAVAVPESTPRDPNAPPKRGWWQRMIQLDE